MADRKKKVARGKLADKANGKPRAANSRNNSKTTPEDKNDLHDIPRWRKIEILRKEGTRVLVRSGLTAGERVCLTDLEAPIEGMKVRVEAER